MHMDIREKTPYVNSCILLRLSGLRTVLKILEVLNTFMASLVIAFDLHGYSATQLGRLSHAKLKEECKKSELKPGVD